MEKNKECIAKETVEEEKVCPKTGELSDEELGDVAGGKSLSFTFKPDSRKEKKD